MMLVIKSLQNITSIDHKNKLINIFADIKYLTEKLSVFSSKKRTMETTARFVKYFYDSAVYKKTLNSRSKWLTHYGQAVVNNLKSELVDISKMKNLGFNPENVNIMYCVINLVEVTGVMRACYFDNPQSEKIIQGELSLLIDYTASVYTDNTSLDFIQIVSSIKDLSARIKRKIDNGHLYIKDLDELTLVWELKRINYRLKMLCVNSYIKN